MATDYTLRQVHEQALARYERLHDNHAITDSEFDLLRTPTSLGDVVLILLQEVAENEARRTAVDKFCRNVSSVVVEQVDRFSGAIGPAMNDGMSPVQ
jgi:hypothetical protein